MFALTPVDAKTNTPFSRTVSLTSKTSPSCSVSGRISIPVADTLARSCEPGFRASRRKAASDSTNRPPSSSVRVSVMAAWYHQSPANSIQRPPRKRSEFPFWRRSWNGGYVRTTEASRKTYPCSFLPRSPKRSATPPSLRRLLRRRALHELRVGPRGRRPSPRRRCARRSGSARR